MIEVSQTIIFWLALGVFLFTAELGVPGVGLMFAGFGALTVGMLLNFQIIPVDNILFQIVVFLGTSACWTFILWNPLKKLRLGKKKSSYSNIIGEVAIVGTKELTKGSVGEVLWSGTIMKAKLADSSIKDVVESGSNVKIEDIIGNILIVTPKI